MTTHNYGQWPFADLMLAQRIAYTANNTPEYIGYAAPGSADGDSAWMIYKLSYSGNLVTSKTWAGGTNFQDKKWAQRESYSYS